MDSCPIDGGLLGLLLLLAAHVVVMGGGFVGGVVMVVATTCVEEVQTLMVGVMVAAVDLGLVDEATTVPSSR